MRAEKRSAFPCIGDRDTPVFMEMFRDDVPGNQVRLILFSGRAEFYSKITNSAGLVKKIRDGIYLMDILLIRMKVL
jgi:hypothetical protein